LYWCGAAQSVVNKGLAWTGGRSYFRGDEVLKFEMPHEPTQRFAPMTNIQQFYLEEFALRAAEKNFPGLITMRWDTRIAQVANHADHAMLTLEGGEQLRADWLIACDGGRSTVRDQLGLQLKGVQYEGRYVIVDVAQKSTRLQTHPVERLAWFDPPTNPGSTILMHRQPDDVWRIDYQVRDDEDPAEAVKSENVLLRVKAHLEWMGEVEPWTPQWISIYNAKCLTLDEYRHGRIFFAGDAAHMVPIFGVRGLNSGVDDVGNLAWKLASVIRGEASDALLDTYSSERRAAALINIDYGSKSTEFMSPPNHGFDLMRQAALRLAGSTPQVRSLINPRQSTPVRCPVTESHESMDTCSAVPGYVAPEARVLIDGTLQHLTQNFGPSYGLLCFGDLLELEGVRSIALNAQTDPAREARTRYDAGAHTAVLVRPDGYIAARWDAPASLASLKQALHNSLHPEKPHASA
jgi:3-(3-hydroxy-phenyl)propionate hydroxylase